MTESPTYEYGPQTALYVRDGALAVRFINEQIAAAKAAGAFVVYTQDWHPESTPHFAKDGGIWPVHCVGGEWGSGFHPNLSVAGPTVKKGTSGEDGYSGFTMRDPVSGIESPTELEGMLRERTVDRVAVLGLATDYCVKATALDAARLGFDTTLLADGVRAVNLAPGDGARAVAEMVAGGVTIG
jgi:nicotinamidase/pyrazinamidase